MKNKSKFILSLILSYGSITVMSGQENIKQKGYSISAVSLTNGLSLLTNFNVTYDEVINHSRTGQYLRNLDESEKYQWREGDVFHTSWVNPSVYLSFHPYSKTKQAYNPNRELRLGLGFNNTQLYTRGTRTETVGDTSTYFYIHYTEKINNVNIDGAFIYKSDPERRINLYIGCGLALGVSVNSDLSRTTTQSTIIQDTVGGVLSHFGETNSYGGNFALYNSYYVETYVPAGISMRLSKERAIINNFNVFAEGRIGLSFRDHFRADSRISNSYSILCGIRYKLGV